jgi:hypothetical protein
MMLNSYVLIIHFVLIGDTHSMVVVEGGAFKWSARLDRGGAWRGAAKGRRGGGDRLGGGRGTDSDWFAYPVDGDVNTEVNVPDWRKFIQ